MSNNKQSSIDFYRIESQKLMIKAIRKEITEKEWRLLENKLGEQAKAMHKEQEYETRAFWFGRGVLAAKEGKIEELKPTKDKQHYSNVFKK